MNLLDDYVRTSGVLSPKEFNQDPVLDIVLDNMAHSLARFISERKKELPKEDCLFVLTCKIYKLTDYMKAHPVKKEVNK
jgi:cytochrome b involved in lipid metabolism